MPDLSGAADADRARHRAIARRQVFDGLIQLYRKAGVLAREVHDVGELLDLAAGRGAFIRALGTTPAWPALVGALRDDTLPAWYAAYRLDVPWIREWLSRAWPIIAAAPVATVPHIDVVLFGADDGCAPRPDTIGLLAALAMVDPLDEWTADEVPPMPALETKARFQARMAAAWDRRAAALGGATPRKRAIHEHAAWCAHFMAGATIDGILVESPALDRSTVLKAITSFAAFVELPSPRFSGVNLYES